MSAALELATVIHETEARVRQDREAAISSPTVTALMLDGQSRLSAGPFSWTADLPAALGGQNRAPSPTLYLLGALAGCAAAFVQRTLAPQLGVQVDDVRVVASCRADAAGLLGIDGASPELQQIELDVTIHSTDSDQAVDRLSRAWLDRCPVYLALVNPNAIAVRFVRAAQVTT